ncbi:MAG: ADOP family duplicated permease [Candidatus Korobacteraceae bacterium]
MSLLNRISVMFRSSDLDRELDDELRSHIEMRTQDNIASGMSSEHARRDALLRFGNPAMAKENTRATRIVIWLETILQDLRYALRQLRKNPGFTIVAVLTLALGIGANTAIFSLINALVLRPLPIRDPGQLVRLSTTSPENPDREGVLTLAMYQQLRRDQQVFSDLFATIKGGVVNLEANGTRYAGGISTVTGEYFSTLGIQPVLGRLITPDDLSLDGGLPAAVAVLDYGCWQRRYDGNPSVIGKTIRVEDRPLTIVGITPKNFSGLIIDAAPDFTVPIGYSGRTIYRDRKGGLGEIFARLKPGVTLEQARAQLEAMWPTVLQASLPEDYAGEQREAFLSRRIVLASASTGSSFLRQRYTRPLFVLMIMVGLLLLMACANLASLMLARAGARRQELGIRVALGAGKWRIVRQMVTESLLLSTAGAVLGLLFAYWTCRLLLDMMWTGLVPLALDPAPDLRVLAFTLFASLLTGILFGISPAWGVFQIDASEALQQNGRSVRGGAMTFGKILISGQFALSLMLVFGALIFMRSLKSLRSVDVGFRPDGISLIHLFPRSGGEMQPIPNRVTYYRELAERLKAVPSVESVSYSHMGPVLHYEYTEPASVPLSQAAPVQAVLEAIGPEFFHLTGMSMLAGREFDWRDNESSKPMVIISESLSQRLFSAADPIGRKIDFGDRKALEVIGVVNSASLWMPQSRKPMAVYLNLMQMPAYNSLYINIRTTGDPGAGLSAARAVLESLGRHTVLRTETLHQRLEKTLATDRMIAALSSAFGGVALLLASIGLYGLMSYTVARRTSEFGIRMALGANRLGVIRLVLREAVFLLSIGLGVGIVLVFWAGRTAASLLFGIKPHDIPTLIGAMTLLTIVAVVASYFPAHRATRIDPMAALRSE